MGAKCGAPRHIEISLEENKNGNVSLNHLNE